jgi:phenylacetate-coenzyme A ligase PaaK-like adenylate-forming protein
MSPTATASPDAVQAAAKKLDAHLQEVIQWHFSPETGTPFWLEWAKKAGWDPRKEVKTFADLAKFGHFEDEWLRGGPVRRWVPKGYADKGVYVFETGGTTGIPKSRVVVDDFRIDYEMFSKTLPDSHFPKGSNWLMLGPSGPRRLRLAVEHLCQHRGGICFCVDLDPRWVIKLIKRGAMQELNLYKDHVIDQALTILSAGHDIKCMFTTPKLLDSLAARLEKDGSSVKQAGITGVFCGGTEMTAQWARFAVEELLGPDIYMAACYGNTLMGLARARTLRPEDQFKIIYHAPQPRAVIQLVDLDNPEKVVTQVGQTGRVMLTTLTKEFFVPRFFERDEAELEPPCEEFPWHGVSGVRPYRVFAATTTVGVY